MHMKFRLLAAFALLLMAGSSAGFAQEQPVELDANESPPYWSASMPMDGMCGEIVHAISAAAGLVSHINYKPLQRLIEEDDNNDLGNPNFYMANQEFAAIVPVCIYQTAIFYYAPRHKKGINIQRVEDLKGYRIGILSGTLVDRAYFEKVGIVFEESYSRESLFKKMKLGRIDMCIVADMAGHQIISQLFPEQHDDFVSIHLPGSAAPLAILLDKDYPHATAIGERYRQGLQSIIKNGKYKEIVDKYFDNTHVDREWRKHLERFSRVYNFIDTEEDE